MSCTIHEGSANGTVGSNGNGRVCPEDPVWTHGRVPNGYWYTRSNRLGYMRWLGGRLGFVKADDWYALTRPHFLQNRGAGLLNLAYNDSPQLAVKDFMPRRTWWPWLFKRTPQGFWHDINNRRAYLDWFEQRMGIKSKEDWYHIRKQDFLDNAGAGLLGNYYGDSVQAVVRELRARFSWDEWRFDSVPQRFWMSADNRRRYMDWLSDQLDIRTPQLWYGVTSEDVRQNHGITLLAMHGGSVYELIKEYLPHIDWKPWLFSHAPHGFWKKVENRRTYLRWLGEELGFRKPSDWYRVTRRDFKRTGGVSVFDVHYGNSRLRAVRELYPNYRWNASRFKNAASR